MTIGLTALVIAPSFFGYEKDIVAELERQGFSTRLIDERPSNRSFFRAIVRIRKGLLGRQIERHYRAKQAEIEGETFDLVLVIKAEVAPRWFLESLRARNPRARFVFYTFDAINNARNCLDVLDLFDERLSFDPADVALRRDFSYLPLFYTPEFFPLPDSDAMYDRQYRLTFIGTLHSDRYRFAKRMFAGQRDVLGMFYVQARWYFILVKYVTREHAHVPWKDVSFTTVPRAQVAEIFRNSSAVLDMPRTGQTGLTMRTFEVLASGASLITTNAAIVNEPFYDPERIIVAAADCNSLPNLADDAPLDKAPPYVGAPAGFDKYSLRSWISVIRGER